MALLGLFVLHFSRNGFKRRKVQCHSKYNNLTFSTADILALEEESKILGRCWDVLKVVTCLQSSLWASPHRPTQCSKTGLKMSDWKCDILTEPSNGQESYSPPLEQGYLSVRWCDGWKEEEEGDVHSLMMAMGFLPQCSIKALPPDAPGCRRRSCGSVGGGRKERTESGNSSRRR